MAKKANNRTSITVTNPISNMLKSQLDQQVGDNAMVKNLASSFLTSASTFMEYDIKQANSMQGGLIFTMGFMWILHFKMNQVQPLLIQTVTALLNMVYSPLFQVYVLGRNLERPFKTPVVKGFGATEESAGEQEEAKTDKDASESATNAEEDNDEDEDEEEGDDEEQEEEKGDDEEEQQEDDDDEENDDESAEKPDAEEEVE
jgi:hypothetical protein